MGMRAISTNSAPPAIRWAVRIALGVAGAALLLQIGVALGAQHSLTQVEAIIGLQARMLAAGEGIYPDLDAYPYTVTPYGPIVYGASALLQKAGLPALLAGRLLSITALLATLWLAWRLLGHWGVGALERAVGLALLAAAGVILVAATAAQVARRPA